MLANIKIKTLIISVLSLLMLLVASIGAFGFGLTQLLFLYTVMKCIRGGEKASARVWDGATGLEWTLPSPPPHHTFATPPVIK